MAILKAALFDTCILIDYLNGVDAATDTLAEYGSDPAVSVITWMEVMVGAKRLNQETLTRRFLEQFKCLSVSEAIAEQAILIRSQHGVKLPDAIIGATAQVENRLLITRNVKDFKSVPGVIYPYPR
jgi:predicted nucleic acid-binding protein